MKSSTSRRTNRRKQNVDAPAPMTGLAQSIIGAQISSVVAVAFVLFAAGSIAAGTLAAGPELAAYNDVALAPVASHARVLGVTTSVIDDSALEAGDPQASLSAKPVSFDSTTSRWDYNIGYKISGLNGSATLMIGSYVVSSSITGSGITETGAILKPQHRYIVSLWAVDSSGGKNRIARYELKTKNGNANGGNSDLSRFCLPPTSSSTPLTATGTPISGCFKTNDGRTICAQTMPCLPPRGDQGGDNHGGQGDHQGPPPPPNGPNQQSGGDHSMLPLPQSNL